MLCNNFTKTVILMAACALTTLSFARVKYVKIEDDGASTPTIEVFQTEDANGNLHYTTLKGGDVLEHNINIGVKVEGQCRWGYRLSRVLLENNYIIPSIQGNYDFIGTGTSQEATYSPVVSLPIIEQDVSFTSGNRTLGARIEYLTLPLEYFEPVIDFGNNWVAEHSSYNIRYSDWTAFLDQPVALAMRCARTIGYTGLDKWWGWDTYWKPIRIVYRGASAEFDLNNLAPGQGSYFDPSLPNGQLGDIVNVDANLLILTNDQANDCKLNLSATFTTNGETVIFYHLVDDRGVMSPLYKVAVDQTHVAFANHVVDLSEREPEGPFTTTDRGFSALPTDRLQGFYQIQVVSPYKTTSDIASYNIEPCNTRPDTITEIVGN